MIKLELRLRECNLFDVQKQLSVAFCQTTNRLLHSRAIKVSEIQELYNAITNQWDRKFFPHIVGYRCVKLKSRTLDKLPAELLSAFSCFDIYRAKVSELHSDKRGRFLALKRFYLTEAFSSYPEFHDYKYNYVVFVNDALYYHDLEAILYQNEAFGQLVSRKDFNFLIDESAFLCKKLRIYVPGYQQSAYMRCLSDYMNDLIISTIEGEVVHVDTKNNMQVKINQRIFTLPYYEHSCQPPYLQLLLLGQRMRFVRVGRNTVSMRRYRNIHCAKLNAIIQKGEPIKGTIISKKLVNMVLDLGYGIRALLPIEKRYQKVIFQQFQIGDIILVHRTQPIDAFYMNQVEGYRFFSLHAEIRMVVGLIVKFIRKGYKSFIKVVLGVNESTSVECEPTSHIYYGPGHYVILKRDEMGNFFLYKSLEKQYVSFSYIPQANTSTIFSNQYQYNISYAHSETIPMGKLIEVQPTCAYSLVPGNFFYYAVKSLGTVDSVTLPDFIGQPVNIGIDFCKRHGLTSPHIEYIPIEDSVSDENYILEMYPESGTAICSSHQILFVLPKLEVSPFQLFQDEQVYISSSTFVISKYLNIDFVFDEEWKTLFLEFFVNHIYATRFQLMYYLKLYQFEKGKPLERLISRCLALNILIQCDIQNEHRRSVRAYTLNPYVAGKCRQKVNNHIISHNVVYRLWDSASIKAALSINQAYLYLLSQYQNVPSVQYYSECAQYIKPTTAEKGFVKVHLCCILPGRTMLIFESVRDFTKTQYLNKKRLSYPEEYIDKILRLNAFVDERISLGLNEVVLYLLCETPTHQERLQNELNRNPRIQELKHVRLRYISDMDTNPNKFNSQVSPFPQIYTIMEEMEDDIR